MSRIRRGSRPSRDGVHKGSGRHVKRARVEFSPDGGKTWLPANAHPPRVTAARAAATLCVLMIGVVGGPTAPLASAPQPKAQHPPINPVGIVLHVAAQQPAAS